jgi:hypothetical protein
VLPHDDVGGGEHALLGLHVDRVVGVEVVERAHDDARQVGDRGGEDPVGARPIGVRMRLDDGDHEGSR